MKSHIAWRLGLSLACALAFTGCGTAAEKVSQGASDMSQMSNRDHMDGLQHTSTTNASVATTMAAGAPSLTAHVELEGRELIYKWEAVHFTLSAEHYGKAPVAGEGHSHLYIKKKGEDGVGKKYGVKKKVFAMRLTPEEYPPGAYTVTATLETNDHQEIPGTRQTFDITVK